MKFLEAIEKIKGTGNITRPFSCDGDYWIFKDGILYHVTRLKNGQEHSVITIIRSEILEANDWTVIKKENLAEQKLETKMDTLLSALFDYANDGDAGPRGPLLSARDVKLRNIIFKLQKTYNSLKGE